MQYFWMRKKGHKNCLIGKNRLLFLLFFPFVFMCQFWGYYFFLSEGDDDENEEDEEDDGEDEDEPGLDYLQKENLEVGILHCFFLWGSIERMWKCCWLGIMEEKGQGTVVMLVPLRKKASYDWISWIKIKHFAWQNTIKTFPKN